MLTLLACALALLQLMAPARSHAVTPAAVTGRLSIKPIRFKSVSVAPGGATLAYTLLARNDTGAPLQVEVHAYLLRGSSNPDALVQPTRGNPATDATSWVKLPYTNANWPTIASGATLKVPFQLDVPTGATPGTYAVALAVSQTVSAPGVQVDGAEQGSQSRVDLGAAPASQVIFDVTGDTTPNAKVRSVDAPRVVWGGSAPEFTVRVKNTGTTQLQLDSRVTLSPFWGAAGRQLDAQVQPALPEGERVFRMRWSDPPLFGWFEPKLLVVGGAGSDVKLERTLPTVWVLPPWWMLALLVLAIALPLTVIVRRRRSGHGQAVRSAKAHARIEHERRVSAAKARAAEARRRDGR
ncbi:MAG: hypothetical protein JWN72_1227 [Thermoleophilia bacterium]|nr:hypothetical protein [Thermoleophilia bacterium]